MDLPTFTLSPSSELGSRFLSSGLGDYVSAARYIHDLPYGRNSNRSDYRLVFEEGRGTCSTKHALLAALAREHGEAVDLLLGVYEMNGDNTPGVDEVLGRYGLSSVPEAHCYLAYRGERVDLTRVQNPTKPALNFLHEERTSPDQIDKYKVEMHQSFVHEWAAEHGLEFGLVWQAREECIEALTESTEA